MASTIKLALTKQSYVNILTAYEVGEAVYDIARDLAADANSHCDHPEQGELYVARRTHGERRLRAAVMPSNARTMAHENKHHTLLKVIGMGIL